MTRFITISILVHLLAAVVIVFASKGSLSQWISAFHSDAAADTEKAEEAENSAQTAPPQEASAKEKKAKFSKRKTLKKASAPKTKKTASTLLKKSSKKSSSKKRISKKTTAQKPASKKKKSSPKAAVLPKPLSRSSLKKKGFTAEQPDVPEEVQSLQQASRLIPSSEPENPIPDPKMFNEESLNSASAGALETPPDDEDIPLIPKDQSIQHSLGFEKADNSLESSIQNLPQKALPDLPKPSNSVKKEKSNFAENSLPKKPPKNTDARPMTVKKPKVIKSQESLRPAPGNPQPRYPKTAQQKKQQGSVLLLYFVDDAGLVEQIQLLKSSGYSELDNEALRTLSRQEYLPGQSGWYRHRIDFKLKNVQQNSLSLNSAVPER